MEGFTLKRLIIYTVIILIVTVSFLFSPHPYSEKDYCGQFIRIGNYMGFTFNCDAGQFCKNARYPSMLLEPGAQRQSRPLYILGATFIGYPLQWTFDKIDIGFLHKLKLRDEQASEYVGFYAGYVLMNYLLLLLSLYYFERIARTITKGNISNLLLYAFMFFLVSNEITKAFFWTPHQQFFSLLTPLLSIHISFIIWQKQLHLKKLLPMSALCGFLMLAYGNFLPMFCCLVVVSFFVDKKFHALYLISNVIVFAAPTLLWIIMCNAVAHSYYNYEMVTYHQLVWIVETLKVSFSEFAHTFYNFTIYYMHTFTEISWFITVVFLLAIYLRKELFNDTVQNHYIIIIINTLSIFFFFFWLLGFFKERLTFTLYAPILCMLLFEVSRITMLRKNAGIVVLIAVAWHMYNLLSYGPFS